MISKATGHLKNNPGRLGERPGNQRAFYVFGKNATSACPHEVKGNKTYHARNTKKIPSSMELG